MATDLSADRWAQVNEILRQAIELPPAARREFVQTACGGHPSLCREVLELLTAYEADEASWNFGSSPLVDHALRALAARQTTSVLEDKVGPYRILHELGTGGMGTVYLAVRDDLDFEQRVAIKIGHQYAFNRDFLQRRLRTERAILARLEHPNIARLLDGGTTRNGLPFFVMEYVPGVPITAYCQQRQLTTRQRLEMFQSVCHAVHYAHQNLVIHRDLKPGNILVTEDGIPKLIDFGIAKLLDEQTSTAEAHTVTRQRAMTVPYASPEQVRGEAVTTATDVYALGVLLYELLTGCLPFQVEDVREGKPSLEYLIQHVEPPPPSVAVRQPEKMLKPSGPSVDVRPASSRELSGDLDAIVMRAMHKDPPARYASVEQLATDIEHYLQGWPVLARGASARYRLRKFLHRHRVTAGLTLVFITALAVTTVISLRQAHLAALAEERAKRQFQETWSLARSNIFELHDAIERLPGSTSARGVLVQQTLIYLDRLGQQASSDPKFQRELGRAYIRVGEVQGRPYTANLGDVPGALKSYETGRQWLEKACQLQGNDFECLRDLSISYERLGELVLYRNRDFTAARFHLDRAATLRERLTGLHPEHPEVRYLAATLAIANGDWHHMQGNATEALKHFAKAYHLLEPVATGPSATLSCKQKLAGVLQRKVYGLLSLGRHLRPSGLSDEAQRLYQRAWVLHQRALALRQHLLDSQPTSVELRRSVLDSLVDEAEINGRLRQFAVSRRQFETVFRQFEALASEDPTNHELLLDIVSLLSRFATMEEDAGNPAGAFAQWQRIETYRQKLQEIGSLAQEAQGLHREVPLNLARLAVQCQPLAVGRQAVQRLEALIPDLPDDIQRVRYWRVLAEAYRRLGNPGASLAAKARLAQWLAQSETGAPPPAVLGTAADLYLDTSLGLTNPHRALTLLRTLAASDAPGKESIQPLFIKALEQVGDEAGANRYRQTYAEITRALLQDTP
ncbi:serine/threonine-protein kinase [Chloracidobacterium aggregatum]|uniref:Protein kinase n=2 Tax=Chloracidobacterium TaxID=458032 RepID=A0ABX8B2L0_9BACT|nr:serine/threonine-protein kinase [Chloracidobacterium aggregatum]QUV89258.1 protein kinase [Chloracidobacterium sp. S]QUV92738.1 protein kinase [Chloracidobacterium sp. A]QUV95213.1 protein kinase [Chloracidobacterium sp. N]QUV98425.1 protein kinase [Chloracidobacterium sp. E]